MHATYNNDECWFRSVWYTGSDELLPGYALCYDHDAAVVGNRSSWAEKPSLLNINHFAGLVTPGQGRKVGPCQVEVVRPMGGARGILAYVNQNITSGDVLGVQPGSYALRLGAIFNGVPVAMAMESVDRSSTAGTVTCQIGNPGLIESSYSNQVSVVEGFNNLAGWTTTQAGSAGTATITGLNYLTISAGDDDDGDGANVQRNGIPFIPTAGKDIFYSASIVLTDLDSADHFVGLAEIDTTILATSAISTANHIGFTKFTSDGVFLLNGEKATAGATAAFGTLVEATEADLAFYVAGVTSVQSYLNGVAPTSGGTLATANVPILGLTPSFVCQSNDLNTDIPTMIVRRLICRQWVGQH